MWGGGFYLFDDRRFFLFKNMFSAFLGDIRSRKVGKFFILMGEDRGGALINTVGCVVCM